MAPDNGGAVINQNRAGAGEIEGASAGWTADIYVAVIGNGNNGGSASCIGCDVGCCGTDSLADLTDDSGVACQRNIGTGYGECRIRLKYISSAGRCEIYRRSCAGADVVADDDGTVERVASA